MNSGLLTRTWRECRWTVLLFGLSLFAFGCAVSVLLPSFFDQMAGPLMQHPFIQNMVRAMLGAKVGASFDRTAMYAMGWVHPVALSLLWGHILVFCTRVPVGEIDRGTADVLFALPVTRWEIYRTETAGCLLSGAFLLAAFLGGNVLGSSGTERPPTGRMVIVAVNLGAVYWAVAGVTFLASAVSSRRSRALGAVFGVVLFSFALSFLAQFWRVAEALSPIGILHYYRPLEVMGQGAWPVGDVAVLVAVGTVLWGLGGVLFARRDVCTT